MDSRTFKKILFDSLWPCIVLILAFWFLKPYGMSRVPDIFKFIHIASCESSACFLGRFFTLLSCYYLFRFRYDTRIPLHRVLINFAIAYVIYIPLTGILLCVIHYFFLPENPQWDNPFTPGFWNSFHNNCNVVMMYSVFFYIIDLLLFRYRHTQEELEDIRQINQMLEQHQQNMEDALDSNISTSNTSSLSHSCILHSQYGDLVLEIASENILYIESVANYTEVCYLSEDCVHKSTLRSTLKQVKDDIGTQDLIVQCHRGFLVNLNFVESIENINGSMRLNLFYIEKKIPVSRTNKAEIKKALLPSSARIERSGTTNDLLEL